MNKKLNKVTRDRFTAHLYFEVSECLKRLKKSLHNENRAPIIALTSAGSGEGKTFVTLALALQISRFVDKKVLIIDGGTQSPNSTSHIFNINKIDSDSYVQSTDMEKIDIIPDILESEEAQKDILHKNDFRTKLESYRSQYAFILIDARSMDDTVHAVELFRLSDSVLFVIEYARYSSFKIKTYIKRLNSLTIPIMGAILNKREFPIPELIYNMI